MKRILKTVLILSLSLFYMGSGCDDKNNLLPSAIGHISSGVLTECNPNGPVQTCMILANPWKNRVFAFNLSRGQFVKAPTEIGPLVIQAGPMTSNLKSPGVSSGWVFGLDAQAKKIYSIRTVNKENPSSVFASSSNPKNQIAIDLSQTPGDFALAEYNNFIYAFVSFPRSSELGVYAIDPATGLSVSGKSFSLKGLDVVPGMLVIAEGGSKMFVRTKDYSAIIDIANLIEQQVFNAADAVSLQGDSSYALQSATVTKRKIGGVQSEYALMLAKDSKKIELYDLINNKSVGTYETENFPQVGLLPNGPNNKGMTCCNGQKDWFQVLDNEGQLSYLIFDENKIKLDSQIKLRDNASFGRLANLPVKMLSGQVLPNGSEKKEPTTAYLFETGLLFLSSEGIKSFTRIQPPI